MTRLEFNYRPAFGRSTVLAGLTAVLLSGCDVLSPPPAARVASVVVSMTKELRFLGDTARMMVTVKDADGSVVTGREVTWTSEDASIATVDAAGLVTSRAETGSTAIVATVDGIAGKTIVKAQLVAVSIVVTPATATFTSLGDTVRFSAVAIDARGQVIPKITWASAVPSRIRIDTTTGLATALANGAATVVVYAGTSTKVVPMVVSQTPVAFRLTHSSYGFSAIGESVQFRDSLLDARGNLVVGARATTWVSANPFLVSVGGGLATARSDGSTTITATNAGFSASIPVTVVPIPASSGTRVSVPVGAVVYLPLRDARGTPLSARVLSGWSWTSSDPSIATVDAAGAVTTLQAGTARITGSSGSTTGFADIVVGTSLADTITVNTTLTRAGSPYRVTGNVIVAQGITLKVAPGVTVAFAGRYNLNVLGTLEAVGTAADSVRFTSAAAQPAAGDWDGIIFNSLGSSSLPDRSDANGAYLSGNIISFAVLSYGTRIMSTYAGPYITHNRVHHFGMTGVTAVGAIQDNCCGTLIIQDNVIEDNPNGGVRIRLGGVVRRNLIRRNSSSGVQVQEGGSPVIEDNIITENRAATGAGIVVEGLSTPTIRYNDIRGNILTGSPEGGAAIALVVTAGTTLSYNNIENNTCERTGDCAAIYFKYAPFDQRQTTTMDHNNIVNPGAALDIYEQPLFNAPIVATSNYWNTTSVNDVYPRIRTNGAPNSPTILPILTSRITTAGPRP